ncbi:MAG: hypothetical protein PS018_17710, partial [bacterium]|nr:hypothetical protein [bacterium]
RRAGGDPRRSRDRPPLTGCFQTMTTLETGREAAAYFQTFVRANNDDWGELMQGVNPNQG